MKKTILSCLFGFLLFTATLFTGCSKTLYYIDYNNFDNVVVYNSEITLNNWSVTKQEGSTKTPITITQDMIISCDPTDSVGDKTMVIEVEGNKVTVNFVVKYKVEYTTLGDIYNTQYVLTTDEIVPPQDPVVADLDFVGWDTSIPTEITDNITIDAKFTLAGTNIPALTPCNATYGDTLADIRLPQDENGRWEFVDAPNTPVGNAGTQTFDARFIPTDNTLVQPPIRQVTIVVAQKEVEFTNIVDTFSYDGSAKVPTFTLSEAGLYTECYMSSAIDAGTYDYEVEVIEDNYKGHITGTLIINKVKATITIADKTIDYTDPIPTTYDYEILDEGGDELSSTLVDLMGFSLVKPNYQSAGSFDITAQITNTKNFDITITNDGATLTVNPVEHDITNSTPSFVNNNNIQYSEKLSTLVFEDDDVRGLWRWEDPDFVINTVKEATVKVIFEPKDTVSYLPSSKTITIRVDKKDVAINITQDTYTYDGDEHTIQYTLSGVLDSDKQDVAVIGNITKTNAKVYETVLSIDPTNEKYQANLHAVLTINKAREADFSAICTKAYSPTLTLQDFALAERYTWDEPQTHITKMGEDKFLATYTPSDTENYEIETEYVTINVIKADATITTAQSYEYTYNKDGYTLHGISASHTEDKLTYTYLYNNSAVTKLDNAGSYKVTISLAATEHYNAVSKTIDVIVKKVVNTDAIVPTFDAIYGDTLDKFAVPTSSTGSWAWETPTQVVGNAEIPTAHNIIFTPTDTINYEARTVAINFNISKKTVNKPIIDAKTYTGETLVADVQDTSEYTVTVNDGGTEANTYDVVLTLKDSTNYCWAGGVTTATTTLAFVITQTEANVWLVKPEIHSFIYAQSRLHYTMPEPKFSDEDNQVIVEFTNKKTGRTFPQVSIIGDYTAKFYIMGTESYNGITTEIDFSISPIPVAVPTIEALTYTGLAQTPTVPDSEHYTLTQELTANTNAGTYNVSLTLIDGNRVWADNTEGQIKIISYTINKAKNSWTLAPETGSWTYLQTPISASADATFGNVSIMYKQEGAEDSTYSATLPTNAGSYVAKFMVEGTSNYEGISATTLGFIISKATPVVTAPTYDMTIAYYENMIDVTSIYLTRPKVDANIESEAGNTFTFARPVLVSATAGEYEAVTFEVTYKPTSANFLEAKTTATINLYKVATIGSTYYGSVDNAIKNAVSGNTITVLPNTAGNVVIAENVTIASGVTLNLPYVDASGASKVNSNGKAYLNSNPSEVDSGKYAFAYHYLQLTNMLIINSGITLTNYGTITVAGELTAGSLNPDVINNKIWGIVGNTARSYAKIRLQENAKLINGAGSKINCFGYIDETSKDNNSQIIFQNASNLYAPIVIIDFRGGNYTKQTYEDSKKISPFNRWEFRNIVAAIRIETGSKFVATANIYASKINNQTDIKIIGDTDEYLITLKQDAYILAKYNIDTTTLTEPNTDKWRDGTLVAKVYGGAYLNSLNLSMALVANISTQNSTLPICDRLNLYLYNGSYNVANKIKLLPGALIYLDSTASLTASEITVYETFNDVFVMRQSWDNPQYCRYNQDRTFPPAQFIINGTANITSLGGKVSTQTNGASLTITNASCLSYETKIFTTEEYVITTIFGKPIMGTRHFIEEYQDPWGEDLQLVFSQGEVESTPITATNNTTYISANNAWTISA